MSGRLWTIEEDQWLRDNYKQVPLDQIEDRLDRTKLAIYARAKVLGITDVRCVTNQIIIDAIAEYHPKGWSDAEIANHLGNQHDCGVDRHRVGVIRRSQGLAHNALSDHRRAQVAARTREQVAAAGVESLSQVRIQAWNKWKASLGWPTHLTIRAVQAVELFYQRGPMTRLQLCEAMGITGKKKLKRTEPVSNAKGGTVLAELQRADLVLRLPKQVPSGTDKRGGVRKVDLYFLSPGVEPNDCRIEPKKPAKPKQPHRQSS